MNNVTHLPPSRENLHAIARAAAEMVPAGLSARRWEARVLAALIVPLCVAAPFLWFWPAVAAAAALAMLVRLAALLHLLRGGPSPEAPSPGPLPLITVLLPLHEEAAVVDGLVASVRRLDYPAKLVEVIALLEEDDPRTLKALQSRAPRSWKTIVVPEARPQTKARACNVGLALARGDVVVIFDGEDRPEPDQARKAVAALAADPRRAVVQARLGCDHARPGTHWLARSWALEYAVLFGTIQPALARLGLPFLLGGTSNWFRASALRAAGGWDAHNVTEDADLGVRLAREGWSSSVIDSTTWEEAPIHPRQWIGQRSRWLNGFAQTTAVHFLRPGRALRDLGPLGALAIVAQLPATLVCAAAHPVGLWLMFGGGTGAIALLAFAGYAVAVALHFAVARREGMATWLAPLMLVYWLLQTVALMVAAIDLVRAPAVWRKTAHGLVERPGADGADGRTAYLETPPWPQNLPPPAANSPRGPAAARRK